MRIRNTIVGTLAAVALTGVGSLVAAAHVDFGPSPTTVSLQRMAQPAEDDPRFDCRYHGNRQCGVRLDPKPSDGKSQSVWYVIQFKGNPAKPVSVRQR